MCVDKYKLAAAIKVETAGNEDTYGNCFSCPQFSSHNLPERRLTSTIMVAAPSQRRFTLMIHC